MQGLSALLPARPPIFTFVLHPREETVTGHRLAAFTMGPTGEQVGLFLVPATISQQTLGAVPPRGFRLFLARFAP